MPKPLDLEEGWLSFTPFRKLYQHQATPGGYFHPSLRLDPVYRRNDGIPKGAVLTHGNVVAATVGQSLWISPVVQLTPRSVASSWAPFRFFISTETSPSSTCPCSIVPPSSGAPFRDQRDDGSLSNTRKSWRFPPSPHDHRRCLFTPAEELGWTRNWVCSIREGRPCL